jgi:hypothetical protein
LFHLGKGLAKSSPLGLKKRHLKMGLAPKIASLLTPKSLANALLL